MHELSTIDALGISNKRSRSAILCIGGGRPRHQGAMPRLKFEPEQEVT